MIERIVAELGALARRSDGTTPEAAEASRRVLSEVVSPAALDERCAREGLWSVYAETYAGLQGSRAYRDVQDRVVAAIGLRDGDQFFDAGCGPGLLLRRLADLRRRGASLTGVDGTPEMVAAARSRLGPDAAISLHDLDTPLPFADGAFGALASTQVLYALQDPDRALAELRRVARAGARLALVNATTPNPVPVLLEHYRALDHVDPAVEGPLLRDHAVALLLSFKIAEKAVAREFHFLSPEALVAALTRAGFRALAAPVVCYGNSSLFVPAEAV